MSRVPLPELRPRERDEREEHRERRGARPSPRDAPSASNVSSGATSVGSPNVCVARAPAARWPRTTRAGEPERSASAQKAATRTAASDAEVVSRTSREPPHEQRGGRAPRARRAPPRARGGTGRDPPSSTPATRTSSSRGDRGSSACCSRAPTCRSRRTNRRPSRGDIDRKSSGFTGKCSRSVDAAGRRGRCPSARRRRRRCRSARCRRARPRFCARCAAYSGEMTPAFESPSVSRMIALLRALLRRRRATAVPTASPIAVPLPSMTPSSICETSVARSAVVERRRREDVRRAPRRRRRRCDRSCGADEVEDAPPWRRRGA